MMLCILCLAALPGAGARAGERPTIGAPAPLPTVRDLQGTSRSVRDFMGRRGLVLLFWAEWSDRSIAQLERLDAAAAELQAQGLGLVAVNVERHNAGDRDVARIRGRVSGMGVRIPVLIDHGLELFHAYGVIAVPSTALVDGRGTLTHFTYGYSSGQSEELFDAIDRLAGIERRRATGGRKVAPAAVRRLQFGRIQLSQGRIDAARSSFEAAVEADATCADAFVELAALALDDRHLASARSLLDLAAAVDGTNSALRRERARLQMLAQGADAATAALTDVAAAGSDPIAAAYLGVALQARGDQAGATAAFETAKRLAGVDPRTFVPETPATRDGGWHAMTAFRREVAAGRQ